MVYKYQDWTLYCNDFHLREGNKKSNKTTRSYFFSKRNPKKGTPCDMPEGYVVEINKKTGMPYLKYGKGRISTWKNSKIKK